MISLNPRIQAPLPSGKVVDRSLLIGSRRSNGLETNATNGRVQSNGRNIPMISCVSKFVYHEPVFVPSQPL